MNLIWITKAEYLSDYKINLAFNDGTTGIADLKDSLNALVFKSLKDKEYFKSFKKNNWTIEWENGVDFAPEFLYNLTTKAKN